LLRYLRHTYNYGLMITNDKSKSTQLTCYSDADYAGDSDDSKSTSGFCVFLNGNLILWKSKKQITVSRSSCESEYISLSAAVSETISINNSLSEIFDKTYKPIITVHVDNQAAIKIATDNGPIARLRHIRVSHHFVRELIDQNNITIKYCPTNEMIADYLTKKLPKPAFERCRNDSGIIASI
jgi:hypothetical protein